MRSEEGNKISIMRFIHSEREVHSPLVEVVVAVVSVLIVVVVVVIVVVWY